MPPILTLVAADILTDETMTAFYALPGAGTADRLGARAVDIAFEQAPDRAAIAALAHTRQLDFALQPAEGRKKKLLLADMDSTMIEQECLDELADLAGVGAEVSAVTERAMRGELDFEEALTERVARLERLPADTCEAVLRDRLSLSSGATTLIATMNALGARTVLVSGGFDIFVDAIAQRCGFQKSQANRLEVDTNDNLTGRVIPPILGREAKADILIREAEALGIPLSETLAMGDGANDLGMIGASGLGIAYRAKPVVAEAADAAIHHTDLTAALYFQGIREEEFSG